MDKELRLLLIERARLNAPVSYGTIMQQLGLDNNIPEDRNKLSYELAEISRFEKKRKRPMLSAFAMYEGLGNFGFGFYRLAEELGYGDATILERNNFANEMQKKCHEFWKNPDHQKKYINDIFEIETVQNSDNEIGDFNETEEQPAFFTQNEISFLNKWAGKTYDKSNSEHIKAKNQIKNTLGSKTVYWSDELIKRLKGFETFNWRMWSQKGWEETNKGKIRVAKFKHYTWARIYKIGDAYKDIFFTVGVDGNSRTLIYKLDYYFEKNSELSQIQKDLCEQLIPEELTWKTILFDDIPKYNWGKLLLETFNFIEENEQLYDEIIQSVWSEKGNMLKLKNRLIKREIPSEGMVDIPNRNHKCQGVEVNWEEQFSELSQIGKAGEELVIEYERRKLINAKKSNYADEVCKVDDGKGYDVFSRELDGSPKMIEVKTTTGPSNHPFKISLPEVIFSQKNLENYYLYRVFNLNVDDMIAEFHEYKGNITDYFLLEGIIFDAFKKQNISP